MLEQWNRLDLIELGAKLELIVAGYSTGRDLTELRVGSTMTARRRETTGLLIIYNVSKVYMLRDTDLFLT